MPKMATKAADNVFYKARMAAASWNDRLASREGASELTGIDRTRLANIELGTVKCANMVMLGAYMKSCSVLSVDDLRVSISKKFTKQNVLDTNMQALARGYELA